MPLKLLIVAILLLPVRLSAATELSIQGTRFAINGRPAFILGISYYAALGASDEFIQKDLDDIQHAGFNWIRVWADWTAFGNDISAVSTDGSPRQPYLGRLRKLIEACEKRGLIVDITLSRDARANPPRLASDADHLRAIETLVFELKPFRNWYLDLGNERNVRDGRFVSFLSLKKLRDRAKELDPTRLITASHSSSDEDLLHDLPE